MIRRIMKEILLVKADGVKFEPDLKGQIKIWRKSLIDMDYQEVQNIAYAIDSGMIMLSTWLHVNYHMGVNEIPLVLISDIGTCIAR